MKQLLKKDMPRLYLKKYKNSSFKIIIMKSKFLLFTVLLALVINFTGNAQIPDRKGWWKFEDQANLAKAEVGTPLQIVGNLTSVNGPVTGNKATQIPLGNYLIMTHGIAPVGGAKAVNEYSLQIDFTIPQAGIWHSFFQTSPTNDNDADLFTNETNSVGVSATGYSAKGISADTWYRMIVTVRNGEFYKIYIDGTIWLDSPGQEVDGRFGLLSTLLMFADNDGEDGTIVCSELGIWDVALDAAQVLSLGGASGARVPVRTKLGLWKFDDPSNLLKAEIGQPLQLVGTQLSVNGPETENKATKLDLGSYLNMTNGILPNGGGVLVNEYSLQIDFSIPEAGKWHAFFQTDPANASDADLFTNTSNNIGTQSTTYSTDAIQANTWYRMVVTVKNGEFFKVFINGELWLDAAGNDIDGRFALSNNLLLFADNDGGDGTIYCSELAIWEVALTEQEVTDLGSDPTNRLPEKVGMWKFDDAINIGKATIGEDLIPTGTINSVGGPANNNYAAAIGLGSYFEMNHGIYGNGDGFMVNEYTLQIDFSVPEAGIWHAFFQTEPANGGDADLFTNTSNKIGTAATSYSAGTIVANTWYRMVITVKNGYFFKIYLDGEPFLNAAGQSVDGRFALAEKLLLFADNDGDDGTIQCSEVSIWDVVLTEEQVKKLGTATTISTGIEDIQLNQNNDLSQNFPNPFSGSTTFKYFVSETGNVSFHVLDITGREVKVISEGIKAAGNYSLQLKSENLINGIYFVQMKAGNRTSTRKMIIR